MLRGGRYRIKPSREETSLNNKLMEGAVKYGPGCNSSSVVSGIIGDGIDCDDVLGLC